MRLFQVGDKVRSDMRGLGYVIAINEEKVWPVKVRFDDGFTNTYSHDSKVLLLINPKQFTKSDLKDGMTVDTLYCKDKTVLGKCLYEFTGNSILYFRTLNSFRYDLTHESDSEEDIIKVSYMGEVLWERQEETPEQKEIKSIREQMDKLSTRLKELEK